MYPMQVELIDKEIRSEENEAEQIADVFLCCVCLDLLYKPVVLACGHASCFWCVQKSMSGHRESHCPLCRNPYHHFPTICHMLHALLLKMYPATYKMRANQILEEEKKMHFFSPTLNDFCASHSCDINAQGWSSISSSQDNFPPDIYKIDAYVQRNNCRPSSTASGFQTTCDDISHPTLIDDLLCVTCKQLLFRPVVINCGHVYCESCLAPVDGPIVCEICQSPHPRGFPKVCLSLDHFIEERFADEYVARKSLVQLKQVQFQHESQPNAKAGESGVQFPDESLLRCCADNGSKVHVRVGCDCCGMYPIIGDRYRCKDCKEAIGFDLCGDCCNSQSKVPGRFNQQHSSEHRFEIVKSNTLYNIILRLLRGQSEITSPPQFLILENGENNLPSAELARENVENVVVGPSMPGITEDHEDNDTPSAM